MTVISDNLNVNNEKGPFPEFRHSVCIYCEPRSVHHPFGSIYSVAEKKVFRYSCTGTQIGDSVHLLMVAIAHDTVTQNKDIVGVF